MEMTTEQRLDALEITVRNVRRDVRKGFDKQHEDSEAVLRGARLLYEGLEAVEKRVDALIEQLGVLAEGTASSAKANLQLLERVDAMERAFRGRMN